MTVEELEGKLTNIYHEFAETISEMRLMSK